MLSQYICITLVSFTATWKTTRIFRFSGNFCIFPFHLTMIFFEKLRFYLRYSNFFREFLEYPRGCHSVLLKFPWFTQELLSKHKLCNVFLQNLCIFKGILSKALVFYKVLEKCQVYLKCSCENYILFKLFL